MTVADLNPWTVPFYTTQNGSSMNLAQRAYNSLLKAFMWAMTVSQCFFCDGIIQEYLKGVPRWVQKYETKCLTQRMTQSLTH